MAFVQNGPDEEELLKQQQGIQPISGTDGQGVAGTGTPSGAGPTAGSFQSPQSAGLSGFTDVNAYLDANKDQSLDLANKVGQQFSKDATQAQSDIDNSAKAFNSAVDQTAVNPDAGLVGRAAADPTSFINNPNDLAQFMKMRDANYQGPTSFESGNDYSRLTGEVGTALQNQGDINSESGRQSLLYGMGQNPTAGQVQLDQLLLGANPQARDVLANAAKPFAGLNDYLNSAASGADQHATQAKADTTQAAQLVADKFTNPQTGVVPQFQNQLNLQATTGESQRSIYNNQLNDVISRLNQGQSLTPNETTQLGLQPGQVESLYALNSNAGQYNQQAIAPAQFLIGGQPYNTQANISNTATPDEVAKAGALQQLMGKPAIQGFDPSQAGSFNVPSRLGGFDYQNAHQTAVQNLQGMDQAFIKAGPPTNPGADTSSWLALAKQAQARLDNPDLYNQPYQQYAPAAPTPTLGGGISNTGDPTIDPTTGKPYPVANPGGTNTITPGGRAFR